MSGLVSRVVRGAVVAGLALACAASPLRAADRFYEDLLEEGTTAYAKGLYAEAIDALHVACFGLLEEPRRLAACLVKLGLSQAATGDTTGLRETFDRIGQIEERFGAYREAPILEQERQAFETELARHVPRSQLGRVPELQERARDAAAEQIAAMPPRDRRRTIEAQLDRNPNDPQALSLLVDLELELGRERKAVEAADRLVAASPGDPAASCTRGRALAADKRCAEAIPQLDRCSREEMSPALASVALGCLTKLERWAEAEALLGELPAATLEAPPLRQIAEQVAAALAPPLEPPAVSISSSEVTAESPGGPAPTPADPAVDPTLGAPADQPATGPQAGTEGGQSSPATMSANPATIELERLRRAVDAVKTREELEVLYGSVADFADRHPDFPEAQYIAGRVAYLGKNWQQAAEYFRRGGRPTPERAELLFYMAVAYFESGDDSLARELLEAALPRLEQTAFVRSYVDRILKP